MANSEINAGSSSVGLKKGQKKIEVLKREKWKNGRKEGVKKKSEQGRKVLEGREEKEKRKEERTMGSMK